MDKKVDPCYLDDPIEQRVIQQVKRRKTITLKKHPKGRKRVFSIDGELRMYIGETSSKYYSKVKKKKKTKKKILIPDKIDYSLQSYLLGKDTPSLLKKQRIKRKRHRKKKL